MPDPISFALIGKFVGAYFLDYTGSSYYVTPMFDILTNPTRDADSGRPVAFKPALDFGPARPVLAALYKFDDGRMQMQALGRGPLGRGLWLGRRHNSWDFGDTPLNLALADYPDGTHSLSYTANGVTYKGNAHPLYNEKIDYILAPTWEAEPKKLLKFKKKEKNPLYHRKYKGPFPAPEVLRQGVAMPDLDFNDMYLVNVDLTGSKLPRAIFKEVQFYNTTLKGATLTGADFRGCVLGRAGGPCSFEGADLTGANFNGANLSGTNFNGATLTKATFVGATLTGVNFSGATLDGVDFTDHDLTGANLSRAKLLTKATFQRTNLTRVTLTTTNLNNLQWAELNLTGAILTGATLDHTDLRRAVLRDVDLSGLDLRTALLQGVQMPGANLSSANLEGVDLTGADLSEAAVCTRRPFTSRDVTKRTNFTDAKLHYRVLELNWEFVDLTRVQLFGVPTVDDTTDYNLAGLKAQSAILTKVNLNKADLTQAELMRAELQEINLAGATLSFADLTGAGLMHANLTQAVMMNTNLTDANLTDAEMSYVELHGESAKVNGALMVRTNFANAYLVGLNFAGIQGKAIQSCIFTGACLANANFRQTFLRRHEDEKATSMTGACLQGADFTGAELYGVNLANAAVAKQAGKLTVTIAGVTMDLDYQPTKLDAGITDKKTTCPCNDLGPCTPPKMDSANAPMHRWPGRPTAAMLGLPDLTDDELLATISVAD